MDFLEKIIQIPYHLPTISDEGIMEKFIAAQTAQTFVQDKSNDTLMVDKDNCNPPPPSINPEEPGLIGPNHNAPVPPPEVNAVAEYETRGLHNESNTRVVKVVQNLDSEEIKILNEACRIFKPCPTSDL